MKDTITPVVAGIVIIVVNMAMGLILLGPLGHVGLAIGLTASTGLEAAILMTVLRSRIGGLDARFSSWLARLLIATAAMALMGEYVSRLLGQALANPSVGRIMAILLTGYAIALVGATYLLAAWMVRLPEVTDTLTRVRRLASQLPVFGRFAQ